MIGSEPSPRAQAHAPVAALESVGRGNVREGWILVGIEGESTALAPDTRLGGMPHVTRIACDLAAAGVTQLYVIVRSQHRNSDLVATLDHPTLTSRVALGGLSR